MRKAGLEETTEGVKIAGKILNNLRYADDTTLLAGKKNDLVELIIFNIEFNHLLSELTPSKRDVILLGDFNIDLLKYNIHAATNVFLETLTSNHFLPAILRPTRITEFSATLIDNIFTNLWPRILHSS